MQQKPSIVMNTPEGRNKYELAIVAAKEARRLNHQLRLSGETETSSAKVTTQALARAVQCEVPFHYADRDVAAPAPDVTAE
jgi:DNA-directed RNA polymerase subunit K/omega